MLKVFSVIGRTPAQGALYEIRACVDENVKEGEYYGPKRFMEMKGAPELVESSKESHTKKMLKNYGESQKRLRVKNIYKTLVLGNNN